MTSLNFAITLAAVPLNPALIVVLCAVAGLGTYLMLPGRREGAMVSIGAVIVAVAAIILAGWMLSSLPASYGINPYSWVFSAIALFGALRVITHPRPVYSALYFVLTVVASAGLFVLLWAEFLAAALVLIYAGAILVTYVFVIMLAQQVSGPGLRGLADCDTVSREPLLATVTGFVMLGLLLFVIFDSKTLAEATDTEPAKIVYNIETVPTTKRPVDEAGNFLPAQTPVVKQVGVEGAPESDRGMGHTESIATFLFRPTKDGGGHLVSFELAGVLLLIGMVGAIVIANRRIKTGVAIEPEQLDVGPIPTDDDPHSIPVYGTENPRQKEYPQT